MPPLPAPPAFSLHRAPQNQVATRPFTLIRANANPLALITGASAGIGASTAQLFARAGTNVVLVARRADKLAEVKAKCLEALKGSPAGDKGKVVVIEADMQDRKSLDGVVGKLEGLEVD